ncbi:MAG: DNA repair protein RecN [Piscirickettsiaceae bacterium]|nr:DNA repair protein RecN [Piscirickettsiaceae bacterium]
MLTALIVRHLAVVDDLELSFTGGMTSLTGETGAGKSILVDAMSLVLGDRADSNMIRHGCDRAEIEASFNTTRNPALQQWLVEQELDDDDVCLCRRTISRDGRSKGYINGRAVPLSQLRAVSERTIDIHGQHEHQSLVRSETQRILLDTVANTKTELEQLSHAYKQWQLLQKRLTEHQQQSHDHTARLELLQYQVSELDTLELSDEHVNQLIKEQQQLAHASQLISSAESGLHQLFEQEQGSAYSLISNVLANLEKLQDIEPRFVNLVETLNNTIIQLDESGNDLRHYLDSMDIDPTKLGEIEEQLSVLHDLARKHHVEIEGLPAHYQQLHDELSTLKNNDVQNEQLQQQLTEQEQRCRDLCKKISQKRLKTAKPLAKQITQSIQQLAIPEGYIEWDINPMPNNHFTETGSDTIQLLVSTNPGQAIGELGKVASGGELARISLAIQVVTAGSRTVPTLVFDEVDVGIGGGIAEIVGNHLRKLASTQQVICITHLPQVAAQAHQQLQVSKKHSTDSTYIELTELNQEQRIEEIARMLGGVTLTAKTRSHAQEMLDQAQN